MDTTKNGLIEAYKRVVKERDALNAGTLTVEETAGYWLYETFHPREEFTRMLKNNDILLSHNPFYAKVKDLIWEVS